MSINDQGILEFFLFFKLMNKMSQNRIQNRYYLQDVRKSKQEVTETVKVVLTGVSNPTARRAALSITGLTEKALLH